MRIVFLAYDFGEYSIRHASAMAADHDVCLIMAESTARPYEHQLDPRVDYRPFRKYRLRQPLRQAVSVRWILKQIDDFHPDVVHVQRGHMWFNWVLPYVARRYPLVLTIHDPRHHLGDSQSQKTPQWLMDRGHHAAQRVIVHGESLRTPCVEHIGLDPHRIHVIPHIAIGQPSTAAAHANERPGQILFFGRVCEYKGLDYLVRAEPLIRAEVAHGGIVIAGAGPYTNYEQLIEAPEQFTIIRKWIDDAERARLFQSASLVVLPYVEATQSGVIPVAFAFAKPVVATNVGALGDVLRHHETGLLVPPRDEQALADAIVQLLTDEALRARLGQSGRRMLDTELSPQSVVAKTIEVYEHALRDVGGQRQLRSDGAPPRQADATQQDELAPAKM